MTYINIFDENNQVINYNEILKMASSTDDDIMITGDCPSKYLSDGVDLGSLIRLISMVCSKGLYLHHLDINPDFDYSQLLSSPCCNPPILLNCISLSEERLKKENLIFYKDIFDKIKEKDFGGGTLIAHIVAGFKDESISEWKETSSNLKKYGFRNICISPVVSENFSIVNFYSFNDFIKRDLPEITFYRID